MRRIMKSDGFTLMELLMVIVFMALTAGIGVAIVGDQTDAQRYERTRAQLEELQAAILGDERVASANLRRSHFGYVGDWGSLPTALSNLTTAQSPAWAFDATNGFGAGWKGPYISGDLNNVTLTNDAWGNALVYDSGAGTITSYSADGVAGGTLYDEDLVAQLPTSRWRATVYGSVLSGNTGLGTRTVVIYYPVNGVITASAPTVTAANGTFSFSNVPFGVHSIKVTAPETVGPKEIVVDVSNYEVPTDTLNVNDSEVNLSSVCCRLTLDSNTSITRTDITGVSNVYLRRFKGNIVPLYDGSGWVNRTVASPAPSVAIPTALTNTNYDIFAYYDGTNLQLESVAWLSNSARTVALSTRDGVLVKSTDETRRYFGTIRTTDVGQLEDSQKRRFVWNFYNRVERSLKATNPTASWTYTTNTWRAAENKPCTTVANIGVTCVEVVVGRTEAFLNLAVAVRASNTDSDLHRISIGDNLLDGSDATIEGLSGGTGTSGLLQGYLKKYPSEGYHYYQWVERSVTGGTTTWRSSGLGITGFIEG